jgi:Ca2+-binding RTX toxin-like protein
MPYNSGRLRIFGVDANWAQEGPYPPESLAMYEVDIRNAFASIYNGGMGFGATLLSRLATGGNTIRVNGVGFPFVGSNPASAGIIGQSYFGATPYTISTLNINWERANDLFWFNSSGTLVRADRRLIIAHELSHLADTTQYDPLDSTSIGRSDPDPSATEAAMNGANFDFDGRAVREQNRVARDIGLTEQIRVSYGAAQYVPPGQLPRGFAVNVSYTDGQTIDVVRFGLPIGPNVIDHSLRTASSPNGLRDLIFGGVGNDEIYAGLGNDFVYGGSGNDRIDGGSGNDMLYGDDRFFEVQPLQGGQPVGTGNDLIFGGDGNDRIYGGHGNDELLGESGADFIVGGSGNDLILGGANADTIYGDFDIGEADIALPSFTYDDDIRGGDGNDYINGQVGNDTIDGGAGADTLIGDEGNDTINGGTGADRIFGDAGDDILYGDDANDVIFGAAGSDVLFGGAGSDELHGGDEGDTLSGDSGNDELFGDAGDDYLIGGAGNDILHSGAGLLNNLDGGTGSDRLIFDEGGSGTANGGIGGDTLIGNGTGTILNGDAGSDTIYAYGHDIANGGSWDDIIYGHGDGSILQGGDGDDIIHAYNGDIAIGGAGNDSFYIYTDRLTRDGPVGPTGSANRVLILGFDPGDRLYVDGILYDGVRQLNLDGGFESSYPGISGASFSSLFGPGVGGNALTGRLSVFLGGPGATAQVDIAGYQPYEGGMSFTIAYNWAVRWTGSDYEYETFFTDGFYMGPINYDATRELGGPPPIYTPFDFQEWAPAIPTNIENYEQLIPLLG